MWRTGSSIDFDLAPVGAIGDDSGYFALEDDDEDDDQKPFSLSDSHQQTQQISLSHNSHISDHHSYPNAAFCSPISRACPDSSPSTRIPSSTKGTGASPNEGWSREAGRALSTVKIEGVTNHSGFVVLSSLQSLSAHSPVFSTSLSYPTTTVSTSSTQASTPKPYAPSPFYTSLYLPSSGPPRIHIPDLFALLPTVLPAIEEEEEGREQLRIGLKELRRGEEGFNGERKKKRNRIT